MTTRDFCYWLQGYFEITGSASGRLQGLDAEQVDMIHRHLKLVFVHDIDPKAGPASHQKVLDAIHSPPTFAGTTPRC